jgi:hypothetical protein
VHAEVLPFDYHAEHPVEPHVLPELAGVVPTFERLLREHGLPLDVLLDVAPGFVPALWVTPTGWTLSWRAALSRDFFANRRPVDHSEMR